MHDFAIGDTVYQAAVTTELESEHYVPLVRPFVVVSELTTMPTVSGVIAPAYQCQLADRPKVKDHIRQDHLFAVEADATAAAQAMADARNARTD